MFESITHISELIIDDGHLVEWDSDQRTPIDNAPG